MHGVIRNSLPIDELLFVYTDIYVQCAADAGGSFLQTNTESAPNYLLLFKICSRKFQPRLTCFSQGILCVRGDMKIVTA